ncbi:MAG: sigma-70 family RNA polymerase sigma factor [bacterium]|nr:sigma-70 family RNA polymerase sigma factor [bacterium]
MHEDADNIRAYLKGNMSAFHCLYTRYERPLLFYIRAMVRPVEAAEDVFQETWQQVVKKLPGFRFKGAFRNWLYTIAHHRVIDHVRGAARQPQVSLDEPVEAGGAATLHELLADPAPDMVTALSVRDLYQKLCVLVEQLPPAQREVFLMRTDGGLSFNEIAALVDAPLNTVLGRMHYAITRLRAELKDDYDTLN